MNELPEGYVATEVPARLADPGFRFARPKDWVVVDLPHEDVDFSEPGAFAPLAVVMAPFAAIVFTVAARPAYGDGTVAQWLERLARERGCDPGSIEREHGLEHEAAACWSMQDGAGTPLRIRLVLFEDGGRLLHVGVMAPQMLWNSVHDTLRTMVHSFRLAAPRGGTAPLCLDDAPLPPSTWLPAALAAAPGR